MSQTASLPMETFRFEGDLWAKMVFYWVFNYWFNKDLFPEDMLNAFAAAFGARMAGVLTRIQSFWKTVAIVQENNLYDLVASEARIIRQEQMTDFRRFWSNFREQWSKKASTAELPLVAAYSLEFIPGKPIVLPEIIPAQNAGKLSTSSIFYKLRQRYQETFQSFLHQGLHLPNKASSTEIFNSMQLFMSGLEKTIDCLFPGDLHTEEGVKQVVSRLFEVLAPVRVLAIKTDILRDMLLQFPPVDLLIAGGFANSRALVDELGIREAAGLSNLSLDMKMTDQVQSWMLSNLRPDDLEEVNLQPLILGSKNIGGAFVLGRISKLDKLAARVLVSPLAKGMGGDYPKLRYCLYVSRQIAVSENFSLLWKLYAKERNPGLRIKNSLVGHYEVGPFSTHNILESFHHHLLVRRLLSLGSSKLLLPEEARFIQLMVDGFGLGEVLEDGTFMPCSSWTWSSYSYKGGKGLPTPLSSRVEEQWFAHELLADIYRELGYDAEEIWKRVAGLTGEGREGVNLIDLVLHRNTEDVTAVIQEAQGYPRAKKLVRFSGNPILTAIRQHPWESRYVLNPGVMRIKGRIYLLYRALGEDGVSRLGLAITDGFNLLERLPDPVFIPQDEKEKRGIEDPRLILIDDRIYMLYTAYDGVTAQIAAASIEVDDFLNRRFERWKRMGRAFEDIWDKDAVMFPEKINGHYVLYHRIEPSIWMTYMDNLEFPFPKVWTGRSVWNATAPDNWPDCSSKTNFIPMTGY